MGNGQGGVAIVKQGYAKVKEDGIRGVWWTTKYLILREHTLDFHKNESSPKISFSIQLRDVTGVSRVESTQYAFEITRIANPTAANASSSSSVGLSLANRELPQKTILCQVKSDDETYDWIDNIYSRCPSMGGVSNPTNFAHQVHVGYDPNSGGFVGLPPEWEKLLTASALTKEDYKKNPQAVIEVLEFYSDITKRANNPDEFPSLTPTPPVSSGSNKQLGANMGGNTITPPRSTPRMATNGPQHMDGFKSEKRRESSPGAGVSPPLQEQRRPSYANQQVHQQPRPPVPRMPNSVRNSPPEEQRLVSQDAQQRQRDREREIDRERQREREREREIEEQKAYNASLPKTRQPIAKQEIGMFGVSSGDEKKDSPRYEPSKLSSTVQVAERPRPPQANAPLRQMTAQRPAPSAPTTQNGSVSSAASRPGVTPTGLKTGSSLEQSQSIRQDSLRTRPKHDRGQQRTPSPRFPPPTNTNGQANQPNQTRAPANITQNGATSQTSQQQARFPTPVGTPKPLNVAPKQAPSAPSGNKPELSDAVKAAEAALTKKEPAVTAKKDVRMSSMTEQEIMAKLKTVVSKDDPNLSYSKQKKIGQGASGSVYVAKVKDNAVSATAQAVLHSQGSKGQVAIKQMDLNNQPRKELIVNEIIVMKDSRHPNIVNFLDAFLRGNSTELWVVMEYMEGGALTDVIDNNPSISEDQIATICLEVRLSIVHTFRDLVNWWLTRQKRRPVKD